MMNPMSLAQKIRWFMIGTLGRWILFLLAKTTRRIVQGEKTYLELRQQGQPVIVIIWHGRILYSAYFFRNQGGMPLISPSRDGELATQILDKWGYKILRGSSSHSVVGPWKEMKMEMERGGEIYMIPDGPKGPNRKLKMGSLKLAQETGAPLVPFTFSSSRKKFLRSWDRFLVFYPFSKVLTLFGEPIHIDPELWGDDLETARKRVEQTLIDLDDAADRFFDKQLAV